MNAAQAAIGSDALLFVGNSYTYQSVGFDGTNIDRYFDDAQVSPFEAIVMAAANNRTMGSGSFLNASGSQNISIGGFGLSEHTAVDGDGSAILDDNSFEILETTTQTWDVIVLQDLSTRPGQTIAYSGPYSSTQYKNFYTDGVTKIATEMQSKGQTSAKIVLFETWAREVPASDTAQWDTREAMHDNTSEAYSRAYDLLTMPTTDVAVLGEGGGSDPNLNGLDVPNPVAIAKVGTAIENLIVDSATSADFAQLVSDGKVSSDIFDLIFDNTGGGNRDTISHLGKAGEFLAAAVLFETIYDVAVIDLIDNGGLTQSDLTNIWTVNAIGGENGQVTLDLDVARYMASISQMTTGVPEPTSLALLMLGGLAVAGRRRR